MSSIFSRPDITEILELISPMYKEQLLSPDGIPSRFINVDNFNYDVEKVGDVNVFSVTINFGTDQGKFVQNVIIKQYFFQDNYDRDMRRYSDLEQSLLSYHDIRTYPIIQSSYDKKYIVFQIHSGYTLDQLSISGEAKNYLLGRIISAVHGAKTIPTDESVVREYILFLLVHMPLTDEEREAFSYLLEDQFNKISDSFGAYDLIVDPSIQNITFQPTGEATTTLNIKNGIAFIVNLGPRISDNLMKDRMFDIASIFAHMAFEEYKSTNNVINTKVELNDFIQGYMNAYNQYQSMEIKDMYPKGITLDLYIMAHLWLNEAEKVRSPYETPDNISEREVLIFSYFLMTESPFMNCFG